MKYTLYFLTSFSLATAVIARAFYLRPNFWSASILLAQSNGSLMVLTNLALILAGGLLWALQRVFYGSLRAVEIEHLYEKGWIAVTETLLSLTLFRDDIGSRFFAMFLSLMAGKIWLWIGEGRVEFLEQQPPANPMLFHTRLSASLFLSICYDLAMLGHCLRIILREARPGMTIMYGFEYTILCIQTVSLATRYSFSLADAIIVKKQTQQKIEERRAELRTEREAARQLAIEAGNPPAPEPEQPEEIDENELDVPGWENKGRFMFYLDLTTDFLKALIYCGFFVMILVFHGLPIHIMRDLYITVRSFVKRVNDFFQYRKATKDMNERYSDATQEDLAADNTCIICREEMVAWQAQAPEGQPAPRRQDERQRAKKLPCGHILHFSCLRSWLERQRVCPTCRRSVLAPAGTAWQSTEGGRQPGQHAQPRPLQGEQGAGFWNNLPRNDGAGLRPGNAGANDGQNGRYQGPFGRAFAGNLNQGQEPQHNRDHNHNHNHAQNQNGAPGRANMRVFNLGPFRIAMGAGPPNQIQGMLDRMAGNHNENQARNMPANSPADLSTDALMMAPNLIHQQVLQLQTQVLQMMRQLNGEYAQLTVLENLVAELGRLQAEQRNAQQGTQGLTIPQVLRVPDQPGMVAQDPDLPPGMVLPPGYTLHRLAPLSSGSVTQPALRPTPTTAALSTQNGESSASAIPSTTSNHGANVATNTGASSSSADNAPRTLAATVEDAGVE